MAFADDDQGQNFKTLSETRQRLVPHLKDLQETILRLLPEPDDDGPYRILDIGTGTGHLIEQVLVRMPEAEVHFVHDNKINQAATRDRLAAHQSAITYELGNYVRTNLEGSYDVVIQELAANNLENKSKRTLLSATYAALRRGGRLIIITQLRGATDALEEIYDEQWREMALQQGASETDLEHPFFTMSRDRTATLAQHLDWMAADGFENVDCYVKYWRLAVIAGDKV